MFFYCYNTVTTASLLFKSEGAEELKALEMRGLERGERANKKGQLVGELPFSDPKGRTNRPQLPRLDYGR
jgi:hypothetical protein